LAILRAFAEDVPEDSAAQTSGTSRPAVSRAWTIVRQRIGRYLSEDPAHFVAGDVVEMDETLVDALRGDETTPTGQRGRVHGWIFGMTARGSPRSHFEVLPNRTSETVFRIVRAHADEECVLVTDDYPSYKCLDSIYYRLSVNHSVREYSRLDERTLLTAHTNTIEAYWGELRRYLHYRKGYAAAYFPLFLAEFNFRVRKIPLLAAVLWHADA